MSDFWEKSWQELQPERLEAYVHTFNLAPDPLIRELHSRGVTTVCDGGCGCGIYSLKLAAGGFAVSGFDISSRAVAIAAQLLDRAGYQARLETASVLATPYPDGTFDCVISRDVVDHMGKADCEKALRELLRIAAPGGLVVISVDHTDEEYETEPHFVNGDGDYVFTRGKWEGMVFHPYTAEELRSLVPENVPCQIEDGAEGLVLRMEKPVEVG